MAGANWGMRLDDAPTRALFDRLIAIDGRRQQLLGDIGEYLMGAHEDRFEAQQSPDGVPWAPLSQMYRRRKEKQRPGAGLLVWDNFLRGLLHYQLEGNGLAFGTDRVYGATHQFGDADRGIPQREFLGMSEEDAAEVLAIVNDHVERAIAGR